MLIVFLLILIVCCLMFGGKETADGCGTLLMFGAILLVVFGVMSMLFNY